MIIVVVVVKRVMVVVMKGGGVECIVMVMVLSVLNTRSGMDIEPCL